MSKPLPTQKKRAYLVPLGLFEAQPGCSVDPGSGRGYRARRTVLTGGEWVVQPAEHVGHTMTVLEPRPVARTPSYKPALQHEVQCSCGKVFLVYDEDIKRHLRDEKARSS